MKVQATLAMPRYAHGHTDVQASHCTAQRRRTGSAEPCTVHDMDISLQYWHHVWQTIQTVDLKSHSTPSCYMLLQISIVHERVCVRAPEQVDDGGPHLLWHILRPHGHHGRPEHADAHLKQAEGQQLHDAISRDACKEQNKLLGMYRGLAVGRQMPAKLAAVQAEGMKRSSTGECQHLVHPC